MLFCPLNLGLTARLLTGFLGLGFPVYRASYSAISTGGPRTTAIPRAPPAPSRHQQLRGGAPTAHAKPPPTNATVPQRAHESDEPTTLQQLASPTLHLQQADGVQAHRRAFARTVARAAADWSRFFLSSSTDAPEIGLALTPLRDAHGPRGQHAKFPLQRAAAERTRRTPCACVSSSAHLPRHPSCACDGTAAAQVIERQCYLSSLHPTKASSGSLPAYAPASTPSCVGSTSGGS